MELNHRLLVCAALTCASAPVVHALSPIAAGILSPEQRSSSQEVAERAAAPAAAPIAAPTAAPVSALQRASSGGSSLCKDGRLIPEFYLIGCKNTGSSSLFADLSARGVIPAPGGPHKEWQYFRRNAREGTPVAEEERTWLHSMPQCPSNRTVMGDFSMTNYFTVPFPDDLRMAPGLFDPTHEAWNTPTLIRQFSGDAAKKLQFMILLREPLDRVQSDYYQSIPVGSCSSCTVHDNFADSFGFNAQLLQQSPPQVSIWFWRSMYARHLEEWLKHFDAAQFIFTPFRQYISVDPPTFSASLLSRLRIQAEPWLEASHENVHYDKQPLDVELPPGSASRQAFQAFFAAENERLVKLLARAHLAGAWLPGYSGVPGDESHVRAWLESSW
mmetsp:Transcript_66629/g.206401  ORF Transcript_66629/g.206401 Transcript_66629/m.206401 type:complete len:386 (-) Transcript_66629:91-1248(-)